MLSGRREGVAHFLVCFIYYSHIHSSLICSSPHVCYKRNQSGIYHTWFAWSQWFLTCFIPCSLCFMIIFFNLKTNNFNRFYQALIHNCVIIVMKSNTCIFLVLCVKSISSWIHGKMFHPSRCSILCSFLLHLHRKPTFYYSRWTASGYFPSAIG